jgi:hypothetical protein
LSLLPPLLLSWLLPWWLLARRLLSRRLALLLGRRMVLSILSPIRARSLRERRHSQRRTDSQRH